MGIGLYAGTRLIVTALILILVPTEDEENPTPIDSKQIHCCPREDTSRDE